MIKILLGVYGDEINAQNINGIEIAKRLDKNIFEVHMFYYNKKPNIHNVIFHKTTSNKIIKNLIKIFVFLKKFDIIYLPRLEKSDILFSKYNKNKSCIISSIEIENALHDKKYKKFFCDYIFDFFSINEGLRESTLKIWKKNTQVLYLGYYNLNLSSKTKTSIKRVTFVGSLIKRKNPELFVNIAKKCKNVQFEIIGEGPLKKELEKKIKQDKISNVTIIGKVDNKQVYKHLNKSDLLLITSDNEGQPKVSLEAASLGVPTCYIKKNYKIDYIENNVTGFEAKTEEQIVRLIKKMSKDNDLYKMISKNVKQKVKVFNWDNLIRNYEKYFIDTLERFEKTREQYVFKNKID